MSEHFDFHAEAEALLKKAIYRFASWASENWSMANGEADTLTKQSAAPREYERGYNDAIRAISDAADTWLDADCPGSNPR